MNQTHFCNMPFNSLEISPDGTCQVCCKIKKPILNENGRAFNLVHDSLESIWNSSDLKNLRQRFLNGEKPAECELCWIEEQSGNISLRQHSYQIPYQNSETAVEYLVLKLSNLCNLKCRICSPDLSTQWLSEAIKNNWFNEEQIQKLNLNRAKKLSVNNLDTIKKWIPHLKRLLAYGGEPFLSDELLQVLNLCIELGAAKNISFTANTNGTIYSDKLISTLQNFKHVYLLFSIDDIEERFEFQRKNAKWTEVEDNLNRFHSLNDPFTVGLFPTFSILNIFNLKNYLDWTLKFPKFTVMIENTIHLPSQLSLRNAPENMKNEIVRYLDTIQIEKYNVQNKQAIQVLKNFVNLEPSTQPSADKSQSIVRFLSEIDQIRNEDFRKALPELAYLK